MPSGRLDAGRLAGPAITPAADSGAGGDHGGNPGDQPPVENLDRGGRQALIFSHSAAPQFPGGRNLLARQTDLDAGILWLDQLPVDDGVSGYVYSYEGTTGHLVPIRSGVGRSARSEVLEEGT